MNQATHDPGASGDELEVLARIERTRAELGETVEHLAAKADVKAQARSLAVRLSSRVKAAATRYGSKAMAWRTAEGPAQLAMPAVITVAALVGAGLVVARRRRR